jgi:hypothetical protein
MNLTIFGQVAIREPGCMGGFHLLDVFGLECVLYPRMWNSGRSGPPNPDSSPGRLLRHSE